MRHLGIVAIAGIAFAATAAAATAPGTVSVTTAKTVEQFGTCFVQSQDSLSAAWSFVPNRHGGTFSNLGAKGAADPYFLAVADRGAVRQLRLEPASAAGGIDPRVAQAVSQCS